MCLLPVGDIGPLKEADFWGFLSLDGTLILLSWGFLSTKLVDLLCWTLAGEMLLFLLLVEADFCGPTKESEAGEPGPLDGCLVSCCGGEAPLCT
jgi:hypothetical protein